MAGMGGGEQIGDREINVEVNIVPFIDLMSVCIIFLLITAVWTQVSMIQLGSSMYSKKTESGEVETPPRADINLRLDVRDDGYKVHVGKNITPIPRVAGAFDLPGLMSVLHKIKEQYPDKTDAIMTVQENLSYEEMIRGMDGLLNSGFGEVAVATGSEN